MYWFDLRQVESCFRIFPILKSGIRKATHSPSCDDELPLPWLQLIELDHTRGMKQHQKYEYWRDITEHEQPYPEPAGFQASGICRLLPEVSCKESGDQTPDRKQNIGCDEIQPIEEVFAADIGKARYDTE
jgi:hypothetical protein